MTQHASPPARSLLQRGWRPGTWPTALPFVPCLPPPQCQADPEASAGVGGGRREESPELGSREEQAAGHTPAAGLAGACAWAQVLGRGKGGM